MFEGVSLLSRKWNNQQKKIEERQNREEKKNFAVELFFRLSSRIYRERS